MKGTSKIPDTQTVQNTYSVAVSLRKCYTSTAAQAAIEE